MKHGKFWTIFFTAIFVAVSAFLYFIVGAQKIGLRIFDTTELFESNSFAYAIVVIVGIVLIPLLYVIQYSAQKAKMTTYVKIIKILRIIFVIAFIIALFTVILINI